MWQGRKTCRLLFPDANSDALGCAANAAGIPKAAGPLVSKEQLARRQAITRTWPWLLANDCQYLREISDCFYDLVCNGKMSLKELIGYVRSVEPDCVAESQTHPEQSLLQESMPVP